VRRLLLMVAIILLWASQSFSAGSIWGQKQGDIYLTPKPTAAAMDAYLSPTGFYQLGPGNEGVSLPAYRAGICVLWARYDAYRIMGTPFESWPAGVRQMRVDSTGVSVPTAIYLGTAVQGGNGATAPQMFAEKIVDLATTINGQATKVADFKTRFINTDAWTNLSLNGLHSICQYGLNGVGGGDVQTGIGIAGYSEHRGNYAITGGLYGGEFATTMYNTGSAAFAFGSLNSAQITTGANASIGAAVGTRGYARILDGAGSIATATGVSGIAGLQGTAAGSITADAIGGRFETVRDGGVSGTILNATGLLVPAVSQGTNNNFGVRVSGAASGGSNLNQSLRIDAGESYLGGKVIITDSLRVQSRILVADSVSCNGTGRFSGDVNVGFANNSTVPATLRVNGGNSGATVQRILLLRNNTTDMALQANGTAEFLQYNHNLAFGTPAGTTFAVMNGSGQLRLGDGNVATHDIETLHSGLITDSLRVNKGLYLGGQFVNKILRASAALDFDLTAVVSQDLTITVTGAAVGDEVSIGVPNGSVTADTIFYGWVSAANTVTVRATRAAGTPNPASGTFKATVIQ